MGMDVRGRGRRTQRAGGGGVSVGEPRGNARGREPRPRSTPAGPDSCFVNEGWGFGSGPCIIACPPVLLRRGEGSHWTGWRGSRRI